jgi:hypothetical protein
LASRILDVSSDLRINVANPVDEAAFTRFFAGLNQERAHFYSGAVVSYLAALDTGSQLIPVDMIGAHLAALKKKSSEDFSVGVKAASQTPDESLARLRKSILPLHRGYDIFDLAPLAKEDPATRAPGKK